MWEWQIVMTRKTRKTKSLTSCSKRPHQLKFYISSDVPHTRPAAARLFYGDHHRWRAIICSLKQEIAMDSKYREMGRWISPKAQSSFMMSVLNVRQGLHLHSQSMLRQSLCRSCQVAGKVGQVFRREDLTWVGSQVGLVRFNLLKDRCVGFSVIAQNVVQDTGQVVDLTWNR